MIKVIHSKILMSADNLKLRAKLNNYEDFVDLKMVLETSVSGQSLSLIHI